MTPPLPGQKWNVPGVAAGVASFATLVGTFDAQPDTPETPTMSLHLWRLEADQPDVQRPHAEEEFYYVLSGSRTLVLSRGTAEERRVDLSSGDLVYVPAGADHTLEGSSDILLLVVFAPNFSGPT